MVERLLHSEPILRLTDWLDRRWRWDHLPLPVAIFTLIGVRNRMRQRNLQNTGVPEAGAELTQHARDPEYISRRTVDGTLNDLRTPCMGARQTRFGRNVPCEATFPEEPEEELLSPSPRTVSLELMTRKELVPATTLNVLAAAWIQFEVHDWFSHGTDDPDRDWKLPLREGDKWHANPMKIPRAKRDPTSVKDLRTPPTYLTEDSHWWDASQIYGSKPEFADAIRDDGGKLKLDDKKLPPQELEKKLDLDGVDGNFWVGLGLLHTLFMREHNVICDRLHREHPNRSDDWLYHKARLVNAALMAKIHTTEWTPAIIAHPTSRYALKATWSGIVGPRLGRRIGHIGKGDILSGIPGSRTEHHGVPYSLTEEFVAVYRMHPLLPDEYLFYSLEDRKRAPRKLRFRSLDAKKVRKRLEEIGVDNAFYSFGIAHPGAISLYNYPQSLQNLTRPGGQRLDLAAVDILRTRERGVPRYNEFRRLFRLKPAESFLELSGNDPDVADHLSEVYDNELERVDLMVGLYAEPKPAGFGFSDTAFRVFILMASRRLKSDRFFTRDYTPKMYTHAGLEWIENNTMIDVLLRHYPKLYPALRGVQNAFAPWARLHRAG